MTILGYGCFVEDSPQKPSVSIPNNGVGNLRSAKECQKQCQTRPDCEYFEFYGPGTTCWLKKGPLVNHDYGGTVGPKHCYRRLLKKGS